jgi:hypothetical protein
MENALTKNKVEELKEAISNISANHNIKLQPCINEEENTFEIETFLMQLKK